MVASKLLLSLGFIAALIVAFFIGPELPRIVQSASLHPTFIEAIAWLPNYAWSMCDGILFMFGVDAVGLSHQPVDLHVQHWSPGSCRRS